MTMNRHYFDLNMNPFWGQIMRCNQGSCSIDLSALIGPIHLVRILEFLDAILLKFFLCLFSKEMTSGQ